MNKRLNLFFVLLYFSLLVFISTSELFNLPLVLHFISFMFLAFWSIYVFKEYKIRYKYFTLISLSILAILFVEAYQVVFFSTDIGYIDILVDFLGMLTGVLIQWKFFKQ